MPHRRAVAKGGRTVGIAMAQSRSADLGGTRRRGDRITMSSDEEGAVTRQFVKTRTSADESAGIGRLNLRLAGFSRQEIVALDDVVRTVDLVPAFHLEGLREIVYLPEAAPGMSLYGAFACSRPKGEFLQEERRIYIYDF